MDTGADTETVETIDGEPVIEQEPVIHPGGSQDVDYDTVSHVGVHSVVQVRLSSITSLPYFGVNLNCVFLMFA